MCMYKYTDVCRFDLKEFVFIPPSGLLAAYGLDSGCLAAPGLDSGFQVAPGVDSGFLAAPGLHFCSAAACSCCGRALFLR